MWGSRVLACRLADGSEIRYVNVPGSFYVSGLTSFEHQVRHDPTAVAGFHVEHLNVPTLGSTEVSVMFRTSAFRWCMARVMRQPPSPKLVFDAVSRAVAGWLSTAVLRLPTVAQCIGAERDAVEHR